MDDVWKPLIVCNNPNKTEFAHECGFNDLVVLANHFIFDLILISTLIAVVAFIYIGFDLVTSQGNVGKATAAKERAWNVMWGYIWILAAWVVVYTITNTLLEPGYNFILDGVRQ